MGSGKRPELRRALWALGLAIGLGIIFAYFFGFLIGIAAFIVVGIVFAVRRIRPGSTVKKVFFVSFVYYQRKQGGDTLTQTVLSISRDAQFHDYRIQYDGNQTTLYFDGEGVATVDIELTTFKVWLQGHTYHRGPGAVLGEFDRFEVSAPLPLNSINSNILHLFGSTTTRIVLKQ